MKTKVVGTITVILILAGGAGATYYLRLFNRPPKADFTYRTPTRTLKYIAPTDRDLIIFLNNSTDPDGDPLTSQWLIRYNGTGEWKLLNTSRDHWGRLPVSNEKGHEIKLVVSDGMKEDSAAVLLPVDPAWLPQYPKRELTIPVKGVALNVGERYVSNNAPLPGRSPLNDHQLSECLDVIKRELECNAVRIVGSYEDLLIKAARMAIDKGFAQIILYPRYRMLNSTTEIHIDEYVQLEIRFAEQVEKLRQLSDCIVFMPAAELTMEVRGIFAGQTMDERKLNAAKEVASNPRYNEQLNGHLRELVSGIRNRYKGRLIYGKTGYETVDWNTLGFDIVCDHEQISTWRSNQWVEQKLREAKKYGKPVWVTDFAYFTYKGASQYAGSGSVYYRDQEYSQGEQAEAIVNSVEVYQKAGVDGIFYWDFLVQSSNDGKSFGIVKYNPKGFQQRKLGFYAYQSFVVA